MAETGNTGFARWQNDFFNLVLQNLKAVGGIPTGRLSGIVNHHIPNYLRKQSVTFSYETNCIEEWETKLR